MEKYYVVRSGFLSDLEKEVNDKLENGWALSGSMSVAWINGEEIVFYQPILKP